jgi:hypothetical protein
MDQTALIEDIVTTKNTLTILHRVFIVNQTVLQPFLPLFDLITELINILTNSSATQIETALQSTGSEFVFKNLKDTLNELSDAITSKNSSTINSFNEQLSSCAQKLRICSSYTANNEETADNIFKRQILQSHIDVITSQQYQLEQIQKESDTVDPFAQFRFARRRHPLTSSENDENIPATVALPSRSP